MTKEIKAKKKQEEKNVCKYVNKSGSPGAFYGLGFIGAVIYFILHAGNFWDGVYGVLKAIVWPALISYKLLEYFRL